MSGNQFFFAENYEKAIEMYNLLIEDYPTSMLAEPVRIRIRKLITINKS